MAVEPHRPGTVGLLVGAGALTAAWIAAGSAPGASTATAAEAPALESLRLPNTITGQRGRARLLVGLRSDSAVRLTFQIEDLRRKRLVRTIRESRVRRAGRTYVRIDAVTDRGFQLRAGAYRLRVRARDAQGRLSNELSKNFRLRLKAPRGRFDAYTIPRLTGLRRGLPTQAAGQVVAALAPGGRAVRAGLRKGDVILTLNGRRTATAGAMLAARRGLPANRGVKVRYARRGVVTQAIITPRPDWTRAPDYGPSLTVITRREPKVFAWAFAQVQARIDSGQYAAAAAELARWPKGRRSSAPGRLLQGNLRLALGREKQALSSYNQALAKDGKIAAASFGRGIVLSRQERHRPASAAFKAARAADPRSAPAAAFHAYALLRAGDAAGALEAANRAVGLDRYYPDAYVPRGIALLELGRKKEGMISLRRGLLDTTDGRRADSLIRTYLEPNDP